MARLSSLLLVLLLAAPVWGTDYYASPTGDDDAAGTSGDPWSGPTACSASVLSSGDTVYLRGGRYPIANNFSGAVWSINTDGLTYKAYQGELPILQGDSVDGGSSNLNCLVLNADTLTFDSLEFKYGADFTIYLPSTYIIAITFKNCTFDSGAYPPGSETGNNEGMISARNDNTYMQSWVIEDCTFYDAYGRGAIHPYGMDSCIVRRNNFSGNTGSHGALFMKTGAFGNRNNEWYENTFDNISSTSMGLLCNAVVTDLKIHHNTIIESEGVQLSYPYCNTPDTDFDSIFVYNNTFIFEGEQWCIWNWHGDNGVDEFADNFFIFNNIFYRSADGAAIKILNRQDDHSWAEFDSTWYSDYNCFVLASAIDDIYLYVNSGLSDEFYTLAEWQDTATTHNATWTGDPNSDTTTDTTDMFVDRGNGDYTLDPSGSQYTFLSTGGRGGSWPTYIGAEEPALTCPIIALTAPDDQDTVEATVCTLIVNVTLDAADDSALLTILWDYSSPPTTSLTTAPMLIDSTGHEYEWTSLLEDSTYYWRAILADTSCADTSAIRSFVVDSIPPPVAGTATAIRGVQRISGVGRIKP